MSELKNAGLIKLGVVIECLNRAAEIMDRFAVTAPTVFRTPVNGRLRYIHPPFSHVSGWEVLGPVWDSIVEVDRAVAALGILNDRGFPQPPGRVGLWEDWRDPVVPASHEPECRDLLQLGRAICQWNRYERQAGNEESGAYWMSIPSNTSDWAKSVAESARSLAERLKLPHPAEPSLVTEEEALSLLATRPIWSVDVLPLGIDQDMLMCLDEQGWIEVRCCNWHNRDQDRNVEGGTQRYRAHTGWYSPVKQAAIGGTWNKIFTCLTRSSNNLPHEVRVSDLGRVQLARQRRMGWKPPASGERQDGLEQSDVSRPSVAPRAPRFAAAEDFTWVIWNGRKFDFTKGNQSESMRALWESWERGGRTDGCGLSEKTIGAKVDSASDGFRLIHVFRNHPAWETVIRPVTKGVFALFSAESPLPHT